MQKEIAALIDSMTKKRDQLNAAIGALSRVRTAEDPKPSSAPKPKKTQHRPAWTAERTERFRATMAARRAAKANGSIPGEGPTPVPEMPIA